MGALIGRTPDPVADRQALLGLRHPGAPSRRFLRQLWADGVSGSTILQDLFPGLSSLDAPSLADRVGIRAANGLLRAGIGNWGAVATETPRSLQEIPGFGPRTVEEILLTVAREWSAAQLGERGREIGPLPDDDVVIHLRTVSTWAADACNASGAVEALVAAAGTRGRLPVRVEDAMRALARFEATGQGDSLWLTEAFEQLEGMPGYEVFKRRQLEGGLRPSYAELGAELGISGSAVGQKVAAVERTLTKHMLECDWPIRIAVDRMRDHLGILARPTELEATFAALDPSRTALAEPHAHRRVVLLRLSAHRVTDEWVLGRDVEDLTTAVLTATTAGVEADLGTAVHHLTRLGIREELLLPWIVSRHGFRIVDGELIRT